VLEIDDRQDGCYWPSRKGGEETDVADGKAIFQRPPFPTNKKNYIWVKDMEKSCLGLALERVIALSENLLGLMFADVEERIEHRLLDLARLVVGTLDQCGDHSCTK